MNNAPDECTSDDGLVLPESPCPSCGRVHDAASATALNPDRRPRSGDLAICVNCGAICVYDEKFNLTEMTQEYWNTIPIDQQFWLMRASGFVRNKREEQNAKASREGNLPDPEEI